MPVSRLFRRTRSVPPVTLLAVRGGEVRLLLFVLKWLNLSPVGILYSNPVCQNQLFYDFKEEKMLLDKAYIGTWRISDMELWDQEFVDLIEPGHFTITTDGTGALLFGAVDVVIDCRVEAMNGTERLEFSFAGGDEGEFVCGRGWANVSGPHMKGKIYFHRGDVSAFVAEKK